MAAPHVSAGALVRVLSRKSIGITHSGDFTTTPGAFDTTAPEGKIFVTRFDTLPTGVTRFGDSTPGCKGKIAAGVTAIPSLDNSAFATGSVWTSTTIRSSAAAAGLKAYLQFFWPDTCAPGGFSSSCALEVVVQP